jgi:hypothetical protein
LKKLLEAPKFFSSGVGEINLKQELKPLEVNGITAVTLVTVVWSVTLVIFLLAQNWLADTGRSHWILIAFSGVGLGLLGYRYTTNRVKRLGLPREQSILIRSKKSKEIDQSQLIQDFE